MISLETASMVVMHANPSSFIDKDFVVSDVWVGWYLVLSVSLKSVLPFDSSL